MKRILLFSYLTLLSLSIFSQTNIPNGIVSGTWTTTGSPYLVQGNILIAEGSALTINPGVTVNFQGNYKLLVSGRLISVGNKSDSIYFTAANATTGWQGIRFESTLSSNDSSVISYCSIQNGNTGSGNSGGGIYVKSFSKIRIDHNNISNCTASTGFGGAIYMESSDGIITDNKVSFNHSVAGAIYLLRGNPQVKNNTIANNDNILPTNDTYPGLDPDSFGGGLSIYQTNATVTGNIIINNKSKAEGGGLVCYTGNPFIDGNTITNNQSKTEGGGVFCLGAATMTNNTIADNSTLTSGGGIVYFGLDGKFTLANNTIIRNSAVTGGGGLTIDMRSSPLLVAIISNNLIANNTVATPIQNYEGGGGALILNCDTATIFSGNILVNNSAANGGGLLCYNSKLKLFNNTVANNLATKGGALYCLNSSPVLLNMQVWGNTELTSGSQFYLYDDQSDPAISYSNIMGGKETINANGNFYLGSYENNINADPLFALASSGSGASFNGVIANWSLKNRSASIDAGKPSGSYPVTDFAGNPRIINNVIDIGAIETQPNPQLTIDRQEYSCDSTFNIAIRTKNFRNTAGMQGTVVWDTNIVKYNSISFGTSAIRFTAANVDLSATNSGHFTFSWQQDNLQRQSVPDSTNIFTIHFTENGKGKGKVVVAFDSLPTRLEIDTLGNGGTVAINDGAIFTNGYIITPFYYYFTGSGDYTNAINWKDGIVPPLSLPPCSEIIINPSGDGQCILNIPQNIMTGAKITITTGKKLLVKGDLILQ